MSEHLYKAAEAFYCNPVSVQEWAEATLTGMFLDEVEEVIEGLKGVNIKDVEVKRDREFIGTLDGK